MSKVCLEVEAGSWLTATGIETTVYIGDVDMPQVVTIESFEPLIDKALESYGFGDIIFAIKLANYLRQWYNAKVTIASPAKKYIFPFAG